ncbi:30S ribosomal protein S2 [[Eubacterium] cellulosolvens]
MDEDLKVKEFLIPEEVFLTSGVHIGTQQKSADMKNFIFKVRTDGLYVLNIQLTNERIKYASKFLAKYDPANVLAVSARQYGQKPVTTFAKTLNYKVLAGRFIPGTLTNPNLPKYIEPELLVVTDPAADAQALKEAVSIGIPVIGFCDANNETKNVDFIIPANNKGRRSLAVVYWLLTRETLMERGDIQDYDEYTITIEDFEAKL